MIKRVVIAVLLLVTLPVVESQAGLFFRQGRGLFPGARGVVGRSCDRQSRRVSRRSYRQSSMNHYGYRCANCSRTKAKATFVG